MDLVYLHGPHGRAVAEDLRYSMRSAAANLSFDRVWISGWLPSCLKAGDRLGYIPGPRLSSRYESTTANLWRACLHPDVSDRFVLLNDDFFILLPTPVIPREHRGRLRDEIGRRGDSRYDRMHVDTLDVLARWGHDDPLSYELHRPMVVDKSAMVDVLSRTVGRSLCKRTLYGNVVAYGGVEVPDCKAYLQDDDWDTGDWCVSSFDLSWRGRLGSFIRSAFTEPAPWECAYAPADQRRFERDARSYRVA